MQVQNLATGRITERLYTFLTIDSESDSAGKIVNPEDVEMALGSVLLGVQSRLNLERNLYLRYGSTAPA